MPAIQSAAHPCGACAFFATSVWLPVRDGMVSLLGQSLTRREYKAGEVVFEQGSPHRGVHCVSRGIIAVRALGEGGRSTLLRLAYPGDLVGFRAFLRNRPHRTEARALVASRICTVQRNEANVVVGGSPLVHDRLVKRCIDEIDASQEKIVAAATGSSRLRLIQLLLRLLAAHGAPCDGQIKARLPLSRRDMAEMLGVQPETMSRLFRRLKEDHLVAISGRNMMVSSLSALTAAAAETNA
ncbi:MAG: Crp/Fnr family transcriptional regulator [Pseudorhodobacter sp.]|nr:Crp/Fnr family transcriptional regulator [Pseudorhodobacter sp.]